MKETYLEPNELLKMNEEQLDAFSKNVIENKKIITNKIGGLKRRKPNTEEEKQEVKKSLKENERTSDILNRFIIKFRYNARSDWLKERALSEYRARSDKGGPISVFASAF